MSDDYDYLAHELRYVEFLHQRMIKARSRLETEFHHVHEALAPGSHADMRTGVDLQNILEGPLDALRRLGHADLAARYAEAWEEYASTVARWVGFGLREWPHPEDGP